MMSTLARVKKPQLDCDTTYCTSEDSYEEIDDNSKVKPYTTFNGDQHKSGQHHCQHHHKHNQVEQANLTTSTDDDDDSMLNTVVDNCCSTTNYPTFNLDDDEIQKYFVNISSNFSRNSSMRRSCRNFNKSSNSTSETPTKFGMSSSSSARSRHTTPTTSARASPYIFDQFTNTVACLKPSIPTYYSETSCSSRTSTLSRNCSDTGSVHSMNAIGSSNYNGLHGRPKRMQKQMQSKINFDNATYYQLGGNHHSKAAENGNAQSPSRIKWNFFGDLKRAQANEEQRKRMQGRKLHRSAQNINTVSIWCAENDERNAIIFHHESGIVENCSGNYLDYLSPETSSAPPKTRLDTTPPLNNMVAECAKPSSSLLNMQRNVFSRSTSNIYDVSSDYKIFQKQSNLYRNSINLSQNHVSSLSSSLSSLHLDCSRNLNPNNLKSKVHNASRDSRGMSGQNRFYNSHDEGLELETYNLDASNATENVNLTDPESSRPRSLLLHDPIGIRNIMRVVRHRVRKCLKPSKDFGKIYK